MFGNFTDLHRFLCASYASVSVYMSVDLFNVLCIYFRAASTMESGREQNDEHDVYSTIWTRSWLVCVQVTNQRRIRPYYYMYYITIYKFI